MKNWRVLLIGMVILLGVVLIGCEGEKQEEDNGGTAVQPADLLPADNEISGWTKGTGTGDYQEAYDQGSLYDIIDGGAEVYIANGFQSGVQQLYRGTIAAQQTTLYLFITDQGDSTNCANLLQDPNINPPGGAEVDSLGDEALIDRGLFYNVIYFREDRFFAKITIDKTGDPEASENIGLAFAHNIDSNIP